MYKPVLILASSILVLFLGCGGSSNNKENTSLVIDSEQKALNSFASLNEMMQETEKLEDDINLAYPSQIISTQPPTSKYRIVSIPINKTQNCLISGTIDINGSSTVSNPANYDFTTRLTECKNIPSATINGTIVTSGNQNDLNITFNQYTKTTLSETRELNLKIAMKNLNEEALTTIQLDGTIKTPVVTITFTEYVTTNDSQNNTITVNGTVKIEHTTPNCTDGTYTIKTVEPLYEDPSTERITSGKIMINNLLFTFDSNGNATATIDNEQVTIDPDNTKVTCN